MMIAKRAIPKMLSEGIVVVGLGLMGGSIVRSLNEYSNEFKISAIDIKREPIERAIADQMIENGAVEQEEPEKTEKLLSENRLIVLSMYPAGMIRFLVEHGKALQPGTVVMDICGLKGDFVEEAQRLMPEGVEFMGAHPMAGREKVGYENGDGEMFLGATFILTPTEHNKPETIQEMYTFARVLGFARVREVGPAEHDKLIAYTSHMPHVLASVLMQAWHGEEDVKSFSGGGFRDATRVADINESLWAELFMMNSHALTQQLRDFSIAFGEFLSLMEAADYEGMKEYLKRSGDRKREWNREISRSELGKKG
ncbi:MAG: prephenate dehydrogenase [Firmicutes bacterium]|nr:prephenate dehydrogenase [Bacillota bacterium]